MGLKGLSLEYDKKIISLGETFFISDLLIRTFETDFRQYL